MSTFNQWRRLPNLPENLIESTDWVTRTIVYDNQVWFFNGYLKITRYNLLENTWNAVTTSMEDDSIWPYRNDKGLLNPSIELFKDSLIVFGGDQSSKCEGLDILVILDLRALQWRKIEVPRAAKNLTNWPHHRQAAATWIIPSEERLYILYGSTNYTNYRVGEPEIFAKHIDDF